MKGEHDMNNDDDDAFDEFGVLKPGRSLRVPKFLMDSMQRSVTTARDADAFDITKHRPGFRVVMTDELAQAAARRREGYEASVRASEERWKAPQRIEQDRETACDAARVEVVSMDDARRIRQESYLAMCRRMQDAWRTTT